MASESRSKLVRLTVRNIGCIGPSGLDVSLDEVVCIVGRNNAGKSTLLRAYELAKSPSTFEQSRDRHQHAPDDDPSDIVLEVHIPDGIGNIDDRWKQDRDDLRIVKSRWRWSAPSFQAVRTTWDPSGGEDGSGDWATDAKASGLDTVFSSRLPRPLRIESLQDADAMESTLLTLALAPLVGALEMERKSAESPLQQAIAGVSARIAELSGAHEVRFNSIAQRITDGFQGVFPNMGVRLDIGATPLAPKVSDLVKSGSRIKVEDGKTNTYLRHQGTGARRALFWSMLQVHNEMTREEEIRAAYRRVLEDQIVDSEKKKKAKKVTPEQLAECDTAIADAKAKLAAHDAGSPIPDSPDDPAFPGYILLIDEPENALHPMAARAAQRHLYRLAKSPDWQVMMTTHSPYFINPFEDHTTIVRLERSGGPDGPVEPKTYRSDRIEFQADEKQRLQALQHIDPSFAEIFFGSYPVLVEGDTEHAAFMAAVIEKQQDLQNKVTIVRARGKAILAPLVRVMDHLKIDFGIVHDCDPPYTKAGKKNGMWTENEKIRGAILAARKNGLTVRHRLSVPDFERILGGDAESKDKPLATYRRVTNEVGLGSQVYGLLNDLMVSAQHEPFDESIFPAGADYLTTLRTQLDVWASANGCEKNTRYCGQ